MIERDKDFLANGTVGEENVNSLIPTTASLTIKPCPKFVVKISPHQAFSLAKERANEQTKENFLIMEPTTQGMTRF